MRQGLLTEACVASAGVSTPIPDALSFEHAATTRIDGTRPCCTA